MRTYVNFYLIVTSILTMVITLPLAHALSCNDLKDELFGIEHQYQTSSLKRCSETKSNYCCSSTNSDSCKTVNGAQFEYNKALAKVNMLEGLTSVAMAVHNDHRAIRNIPNDKLNLVDELIDNFLFDFSKANLLRKSLLFKAGKQFIWDGYNGESFKDTISYLKTKCEDKTYKEFCDELTKTRKEHGNRQADVFKMLHSFADADARGQSDYQSQERIDNYQEYSKYLKFKDGDKLIDLEELNTNHEIKKIKDLKKLVISYKSNKSPKTAQMILTKTKSLQKLNMNFNQSTKLVSSKSEFSPLLKDHLEKNITNISTVAGIMTGANQVRKNFQSLQKSMDIELRAKEDTLVETFKNRCSSPKDATAVKTCIKKLCNMSTSETHCQSSESGVEDLFNQYKDYHDNKVLADGNKAMLSCMDPEVNKAIKEQEVCLNKVKIELEKSKLFESDITKAQKDLKTAKRNLSWINKGEPLKQLQFQKLLAIKALKTNNCGTKKESASGLVSFCKTPEINSHNLTALRLSDDINSALIKYDEKELKKLYQSQYSILDNESPYKKMMDDCLNNPQKSTICKYYVDERKKEKIRKYERDHAYEIAAEKRRKSDEKYYSQFSPYDPDEDDGPSGFSYAMQGLTTGVVKNIPGVFGYLQQQKQHERQKEYWDYNLQRQQMLYSSDTTFQTYNMQINYDDWYMNNSSNPFDPTTAMYYTPTNNFSYFNSTPTSFTTGNAQIYLPAGGSPTNFQFTP